MEYWSEEKEKNGVLSMGPLEYWALNAVLHYSTTPPFQSVVKKKTPPPAAEGL